jgi:hypothetical protein
MQGKAQASMGVVAGDLDNDGDEDLFMTHLSTDTNTLYLNQGDGLFLDASTRSGLAAPSFEATGFGAALFDIDNDGWLDLAVANGAVKAIQAQVLVGSDYPLSQPNQLFRNRGDGTWEDASSMAGADFIGSSVSRGLAVGDFDNDGRTDLLLTNNRGAAQLLLNRNDHRHAWVGLEIKTSSGRDALGALVEAVTAQGEVLERRVASDGSYLSAGDPRVLLGLGPEAAAATVAVTVRFVGGGVETWSGLASGRYHLLVEGEGDVRSERHSGASR